MTDTAVSLQRKITSAGDLHSVVQAMKALAASSIGQYEDSVHALQDYSQTLELALAVCMREQTLPPVPKCKRIVSIVFGSDQGLIGPFNEVLAEYVKKILFKREEEHHLWVVGERMEERLIDARLNVKGLFPVPQSIKGIVPLVGKILLECGMGQREDENSSFYLFYNRPQSRALYKSSHHQIWPLDKNWQNDLKEKAWVSRSIPEVIGNSRKTLGSLISEYLFISLFRGCAESLASENGSRLLAMERAKQNIEELLIDLQKNFNQVRQSSIDEELFDVISGFESLKKETKKKRC